jgi:hypothetical protein
MEIEDMRKKEATSSLTLNLASVTDSRYTLITCYSIKGFWALSYIFFHIVSTQQSRYARYSAKSVHFGFFLVKLFEV